MRTHFRQADLFHIPGEQKRHFSNRHGELVGNDFGLLRRPIPESPRTCQRCGTDQFESHRIAGLSDILENQLQIDARLLIDRGKKLFPSVTEAEQKQPIPHLALQKFSPGEAGGQ